MSEISMMWDWINDHPFIFAVCCLLLVILLVYTYIQQVYLS